ncbi:MAG TPA: hypothetical protein VEA78_10010 [Acidimicrobiales bacterium]|nr:hypothetical protein [Acidimicrobiales bacterium]
MERRFVARATAQARWPGVIRTLERLVARPWRTAATRASFAADRLVT